MFSPMAAYDLTFGVAHSIITLSLTILATKYVKGNIARMVNNTFSLHLPCVLSHLN